MALRKPLVIVAGQIQQLQAGDTLNASVTESEVISVTNGSGGALALVIGTPVYISGDDTVKKANAAALATANVIGLVADVSIADGDGGTVIVEGVLTATTAQWDAVTGGTGGLVAGTLYYLDATAGLLTATPLTTVGQYIAPIGVALSTVALKLDVEPTILL